MPNKVYRPSIGILFFLSLCYSSCKQPGPLSSTSGLASGRLWPKQEVVLCLDKAGSDLPDFDAYAIPLVKTIAREFSIETTGFRWTGLDDCAKLPEANAILSLQVAAPSSGGQGTLGGIASQIGTLSLPTDQLSQQIFAPFNKPAVVVYVSSVYSGGQQGGTIDQKLEYVTLHELGHLAGLFHEHAHPNSTCKIQSGESALNKDRDLGREKALDAYLDHGTSYDPLSIMSYCVDESVRASRPIDPAIPRVPTEAKLSEGDKALLKKIYSTVSPGKTDSKTGYALKTSPPVQTANISKFGPINGSFTGTDSTVKYPPTKPESTKAPLPGTPNQPLDGGFAVCPVGTILYIDQFTGQALCLFL